MYIVVIVYHFDIDDMYNDRHRIVKAIQNRHDLEIEEKELICSECIEFSLKKKF